jgi:two-component system OmpR family sensor kinase
MLWIINLVDADYQKEKINIIETIDQIVNDNKKSFLKKNISIKKSFKDKNIYKILNKQQLEICIWNLLKNAIKYSHNNSKIKIEYNNNELIIQDYWIWIEKKNIKKIFNSYFRESYSANEWYWLWLALVKKISDINNWQINIISEKNKGSIIKIKFD